MTTDQLNEGLETQQSVKEIPNGMDGVSLLTDSNLNPYKSLTPIIITPLSINILEQLQQRTENDSNMITSLPSGAMISPSLLQVDKPKNLSPEEKRQRRLWRNRLAAKECRKKKKLYIHDMEGTIKRLTNENLNLRNQVNELKAQVAALPKLETLNAQLGSD